MLKFMVQNYKTFAAPWLTVIIPSYCGEKWVSAALNSLIGEATADVEVLLIDSSPTSATRDIARSYSDRLRMRVLERPDLKSWHTKTNFGVQIAASKHVCWLGVDDVWLPGRATSVRAWIDAAPDVALHICPCAIIDYQGRTLGHWRCPLPSGEIRPDLLAERLLVQNFISAPAPVFMRDAWINCGGLDVNLWYTADWDMWLKLAASGPARYHAKETVGFRIHGGSLTMTGSRDRIEFAQQMKIVLERHLAKNANGSKSLERAARASIAVNAALAMASAGDSNAIWGAILQVLRLGPIAGYRYMRDSRIVDRVVPRIKAKLSGALAV
jgi:hypothetical protein